MPRPSVAEQAAVPTPGNPASQPTTPETLPVIGRRDIRGGSCPHTSDTTCTEREGKGGTVRVADGFASHITARVREGKGSDVGRLCPAPPQLLPVHGGWVNDLPSAFSGSGSLQALDPPMDEEGNSVVLPRRRCRCLYARGWRFGGYSTTKRPKHTKITPYTSDIEETFTKGFPHAVAYLASSNQWFLSYCLGICFSI